MSPHPSAHPYPRHVSLFPPLARLTLASPQGEKGSKGERGVTTVNGKEVAAAILEGPPGPPGESYGSVMVPHLPLHSCGTFHSILILDHVINDSLYPCYMYLFFCVGLWIMPGCQATFRLRSQ